MATEWLTQLRYQAALAHKTAEGVEKVLSSPNLDLDHVRRAMLAVRDGSKAFQQFSRELREADLSSPIYRAASEVEDKWQGLIEALIERLHALQSLEPSEE